jgi:hypothetical protein
LLRGLSKAVEPRNPQIRSASVAGSTSYILSMASTSQRGRSQLTMDVTNRYITIKTHIDGAPKESHFELKTAALALSVEPGSKVVIVKNLYVSIDPYQINRMKTHSSSQKAVSASVRITPGEVSHHVILPCQIREGLITKACNV